MMSLSFPPAPTNGQQYQNWVWNSTVGAWLPNYAAGFVTSFNGRAGPVTLQPTDNTAGNRVLLMSQTVNPAAPVAQLSFFYNFTNQYDIYELDMYGVTYSADGSNVIMQVSFDGSTWDATTNYTNAYGIGYGVNPGAWGNTPFGNVMYAIYGLSATAGYLGTSRVRIFAPWTTDRLKLFAVSGVSLGTTNGVQTTTAVACRANSLAPIKGILVGNSLAGNFTRGSFSLYGVTKGAALI